MQIHHLTGSSPRPWAADLHPRLTVVHGLAPEVAAPLRAAIDALVRARISGPELAAAGLGRARRGRRGRHRPGGHRRAGSRPGALEPPHPRRPGRSAPGPGRGPRPCPGGRGRRGRRHPRRGRGRAGPGPRGLGRGPPGPHRPRRRRLARPGRRGRRPAHRPPPRRRRHRDPAAPGALRARDADGRCRGARPRRGAPGRGRGRRGRRHRGPRRGRGPPRPGRGREAATPRPWSRCAPSSTPSSTSWPRPRPRRRCRRPSAGAPPSAGPPWPTTSTRSPSCPPTASRRALDGAAVHQGIAAVEAAQVAVEWERVRDLVADQQAEEPPAPASSMFARPDAPTGPAVDGSPERVRRLRDQVEAARRAMAQATATGGLDPVDVEALEAAHAEVLEPPGRAASAASAWARPGAGWRRPSWPSARSWAVWASPATPSS